MGVTLERVQNKFACIIGELCNEPIILSQFAIWVDLRIAEFKTKGAISLDCSGDEPEPDWMNGHRLPKRRGDNSGLMNRHSRHQQKFQPMGGGPASDTGFLNEGRLSPEFLLIKEEGLTSHEHDVHRNRKRSLTQTVSQPDDTFYHQDPSLSSPSAAKMKRFSSSGDSAQPTTTETTSNQSLMSIISGGLDTSTQNQSSTDISASDIDVILDFENSSSSVQKSTNNQGPTSVMPEAGPSTSFDADNSFNRDNNISAGGGNHGNPSWHQSHSPQESNARSMDNSVVAALAKTELLSSKKHSARLRLPETGSQIPAATTRLNFIGAVATLECWLSFFKGDERKTETIPVEELDQFLEEFFRLLKRRNGLEYDPDSFSNFRAFLDRFLKLKDYPCSIRSRGDFPRSSLAFKERRRQLNKVFAEKRMAQNPSAEFFDRRPQNAESWLDHHGQQQQFNTPDAPHHFHR